MFIITFIDVGSIKSKLNTEKSAFLADNVFFTILRQCWCFYYWTIFYKSWNEIYFDCTLNSFTRLEFLDTVLFRWLYVYSQTLSVKTRMSLNTTAQPSHSDNLTEQEKQKKKHSIGVVIGIWRYFYVVWRLILNTTLSRKRS